MQLKWPMRWDLFSLFPAYAGVIPNMDLHKSWNITFPRIRGGDPKTANRTKRINVFSPHTRG